MALACWTRDKEKIIIIIIGLTKLFSTGFQARLLHCRECLGTWSNRIKYCYSMCLTVSMILLSIMIILQILKSRLSLIVQVNVVLNRTVVVDGD